MSNTDVVAKEILSDKGAWATSGKEDFQSLLESISAEIDEEMEIVQTDGFLDVDMGVEDSLGDDEFSSIMSGAGYDETAEDDILEESGSRLY